MSDLIPTDEQGKIIPPAVSAILVHLFETEEAFVRRLAQSVTTVSGETMRDPRGYVKRSLRDFTSQLAAENKGRTEQGHPLLQVLVPPSSSVKRAQVMPFLEEIQAIAKQRLDSPGTRATARAKAERFLRSITYLLHRDLYVCGLYDPYPGYSLLDYPIDWIYFPDLFDAKQLEERERFWELLCRNGNYDLFVHSRVRFSRVALSDGHDSIRGRLGLKFARLCIDYGDYFEANRICKLLLHSITPDSSLWRPEQQEFFHDVQRIQFHATSHQNIQQPYGMMAKDYFLVSSALSQSSLRPEALARLRIALQRAFLRVSIRYLLRGESLSPSERSYLVHVLKAQQEMLQFREEGGKPIGGFDLDTLARASALLIDDPTICATFHAQATVKLREEAQKDLQDMKATARRWNEQKFVSEADLNSFTSSDHQDIDFLKVYWTVSTKVLVSLCRLRSCSDDQKEKLLHELSTEMNSLGEYIAKYQLGHTRELYLLLNGYITAQGLGWE